VPGPSQRTVPPSPVDHYTTSGVTIAVTDTPGTDAVADTSSQPSIHSQVGRCTSWSPAGLIPIFGDLGRNWLYACCATSMTDGPSVSCFDSSAIVKLAVREPESVALWRYVRRRRPLVSSALARIEVLRALLPAGDEAVAAGRKVLTGLDLVRINHRVLDAAATLLPAEVRSFDAIHLATAEQLGEDLGALITCDGRMAEAAKQSGYRVVMPR
jgi:predicted nucleic acid-binding protein